MVFPDFLYNAVVHTDTDTHREHQYVQDKVGMFRNKSDNSIVEVGTAVGYPANQGKYRQKDYHSSSPLSAEIPLSFFINFCVRK